MTCADRSISPTSAGADPVVFLDMREQDVGFDDSMFPNETGLVSVAFHPQFGQTGTPGFGKFYTAYSATSGKRYRGLP